MLKKLPSHVAVSWVKTVANGWCTSARFHEPTRFSCVFGCRGAIDETRHYLNCKVLRGIASDALSIPEHDLLRICSEALITFGLAPVRRAAVFVLYIMYTLYHHRKNNLGHIVFDTHNNIHHIPFSQADAGQYRDLADAHFAKMTAMLSNIHRPQTPNARIHNAGAAPVFIQGIDPWIGASRSR